MSGVRDPLFASQVAVAHPGESSSVRRIRLNLQRKHRVKFARDVVDNENMGKRSSKCACHVLRCAAAYTALNGTASL